MPVLWVRVTFALLAVMAGAGVLAYALLWIFVPQRPPSPSRQPVAGQPRSNAGRPYGVAAVGVALLIVATALGFGQVLTWVLGPLGLAAIGARVHLAGGRRRAPGALASNRGRASSGRPPDRGGA